MKQICGKVYLIFWILISKFFFFLINLSNLGSGYTLPGYLCLKFFPGVFNYLDLSTTSNNNLINPGLIKFKEGIGSIGFLRDSFKKKEMNNGVI